MAKPNAFVDTIVARLSPLGPSRARAMFGGHGVYLDGVMMGLIAGGVFYLKADDVTRPAFAARGSEPFRPFPDRPASMSYYAVPPEILDDPEGFLAWARDAHEAARRAAARKTRRRPARRQ